MNFLFDKLIKYTKIFLLDIGNISILFYETIQSIFSKRYDKKNIISQFCEVGANSFPIVFLISFGAGMVLALQLGIVMQNWFGTPVLLGMTISFAFAKELSPLLVSIVLAGRIGAAITAEIGTMKVTEQLDALNSLGVFPVQYLAVPRLLSCFFMTPILVFLGYLISLLGGAIIANAVLDVPTTIYFTDALDSIYINDILHGLIKSFVFATIIAIISIYKGFQCNQGAEGVGKATTSSVVLSIIFIILSDYFLTLLLVAFKIGVGSRGF